MPSLSALLAFGAASLALIIVPGPAVLYIVARSVEQGRAAGLVSVLGIETGGLVHVAAAVIGLSALVASSAVGFSVVKYAGAAYLIVLGIRKLRERDQPTEVAATVPISLARTYFQGMVVNVLNPKTALFFLAFLPQFVDPERGQVGLQTLVLGLLFIAIATFSDGMYAMVAASISARLRVSARFSRRQRYVSGAVYLGLGATAALGGHRPTTS
jgi:threonine/homoserine/homoserine lactone efflux protein